MKKIILLIIILLLISYIASAHVNKSNVDEHRNDILNNPFNMCLCMKEGYKLYPNKREDQVKEICLKSYEDFLMEQSRKTNKIIVGVIIECEE